MKKMRNILILIMVLGPILIQAQDFHFGIRAGLNNSKFLGPAETGAIEEFSFDNGFHFGVVALMDLNDYFSLGTEILYDQMGTKYHYEGTSYFKFVVNGDLQVLYDNTKLDLEISNSYINVPILLHFRPFKKLELIAGGYMGFLISPVAGGILDFGDKFFQGQEYKYYSDEAGREALFSSYISVKVPQEDGTDEIVQIFETAGAYYQYSTAQFEDRGTSFNWFDLGVTGGFQYFFNSSLYGGVRVEYGFLDLTNNKLDRSLMSLDEENEFIFRDDWDTNLNFQVSLGFRF